MIDPSYSQDAEQSVLGMMMMAGASEQADKISRLLIAEDFFLVQHQLIWNAILAIRVTGGEVDPVLVSETNQDLDFSYLIDVCDSHGSHGNGYLYANIVKDKSQERKAVAALYAAVETLSDKDMGDWQSRLKRAEDAVSSAFNQTKAGSSGLQHIAGIAKLWTKELVDRIDGVTPVKGFETGIDGLDNLIEPKLMPPGSLVVVGARPKMGKSAILTMMADKFAGKQRLATAVFSMEMPSGQVWERLLTGGIGLSPDTFYQPLSPNDYHKITEYSGDRMTAPLYIDDTPGVTIGHIKSESRKLARKGKVGLICVDYLTLMDAPKADRNDLSYGKITKELKNLARELGCVVLLLTQLNRKIEDRPVMKRKPMPSDSRDTGQIEQDCDMWIGLFRAGAYEPSIKYPDLTELVVRLNRHGKTGSVYLSMRDGYFAQIPQIAAKANDEANEKEISPVPKSQKGYG